MPLRQSRPFFAESAPSRRALFGIGVCVLAVVWIIVALWIGQLRTLGREAAAREITGFANLLNDHTERTIQGVDLKLLWRTFDDGPNKYILSYRWEVVKPAEGVLIEPIGKLNPVNGGTEAAAIEQQTVRVRWRTERGVGSQMGELSYKISADGTGGPT